MKGGPSREMSVCSDCGQDTRAAGGCVVRHLRLEGQVFPRARVGGLDGPGRRCRGCEALVGRFHHQGCEQERCPRCGTQLLSCGCTAMAERSPA